MIYLLLFVEFFKTGLFALGGGLATLPFLYDLAEKYGWFSKGDIVNMLAVSESTPGAIGVNMSTYSGFHSGGFFGGIVATLGLVLPSIIITICVAKALQRFKDSPYVMKGFYGIRAVVAGLICAATLEVFRVAFFKGDVHGVGDILGQVDVASVVLFVILYVVNYLLKRMNKPVHPIVLIIASGVIGVIYMGA